MPSRTPGRNSVPKTPEVRLGKCTKDVKLLHKSPSPLLANPPRRVGNIISNGDGKRLPQQILPRRTYSTRQCTTKEHYGAIYLSI